MSRTLLLGTALLLATGCGTRSSSGDAGTSRGADSGVDAGPDAGRDAGVDAGSTDAGSTDAGSTDAGSTDAGSIQSADLNWAQWPLPPDAPPDSEYTDNGDGTVTDTVTGLIWQKSVPGGTYTWDSGAGAGSAQAYCQSLNSSGLGGFTSGWRLPTMIELLSIVDFEISNVNAAAINATAFPNTPANSFWTATPYEPSSGYVWLAVFYSSSGTFACPVGSSGNTVGICGNTEPSTRCVR